MPKSSTTRAERAAKRATDQDYRYALYLRYMRRRRRASTKQAQDKQAQDKQEAPEPESQDKATIINTHAGLIPPYPHAILCNGANHHWFDGDGYVMLAGIQDYEFNTDPLEYVHNDYTALLEQALCKHCKTKNMCKLTLFIEGSTWNKMSSSHHDKILRMQCPCCANRVKTVYTSCWWPMDN
jgi:hypothetical protein